MLPDSQAAIRCRHLTKHYKDVLAVDDLDLDVQTGSIFGFLGRNGAGKTTTIRLITGLARPDNGRAWVAGLETTNGDSRAQALFGYLPQDLAFYKWMTARENLDYIGRLLGLPDDQRQGRVDELIDLVGLNDAADRRVRGFSGGMVQRLGLAQALLHRPPVLILDEPMAGLDPAGRRDFLTLLEALRDHTTVFFSTHILADVERVCDTVGILHNGRLVEVANRQELLDRYATNVAVLEVARGSVENIPALLEAVEAQPWTSAVTRKDNRVRIVADDPDAALQALLPLVVDNNLTLLKYEWSRPNLEEIFLDLSEEAS